MPQRYWVSRRPVERCHDRVWMSSPFPRRSSPSRNWRLAGRRLADAPRVIPRCGGDVRRIERADGKQFKETALFFFARTLGTQHIAVLHPATPTSTSTSPTASAPSATPAHTHCVACVTLCPCSAQVRCGERAKKARRCVAVDVVSAVRHDDVRCVVE